MSISKAQRQHQIGRLLERNLVTSQGQLVELLAQAGVIAAQATVSRDLEELGAAKLRIATGESMYTIPTLPKDQVAPIEHLRRILAEWVVDISHSANLVVLRTPPASGQIVASAIDRVALLDVLGTVAGDDTVLVVVSETVGGAHIAGRMRALASTKSGITGGSQP